ncbi:MAG: aminoglycoside phosphotransferase [Clostridiales bacterium]|nr:aminoglycoside phosphotransferase [Clostridiales bacterium]
MKKGKLLGQGMTAEVYEWEKDKVLKLFYKKFSDDRIKYEADIGNIVHEAGVPSPAVFEMIEAEHRKGILFQRIFGKSILRHVEAEPWNSIYYAQQMAQLHFKMHQHSTDMLPSQKEKLILAIKESSKLLGKKEKKILDILEVLPEDSVICHGDLHYENIIVSNNHLVAIDWKNATKGNSLGDVARTLLSINSPTMPIGASNLFIIPYVYGKWVTYWSYLNEYMKLAKVSYENIDAWILPVAAARLREKIPGEEHWLIATINKHLEKINYNKFNRR